MVDSIDDRTPSFVKGGNRFFGIPLSDSAQNSPRWSVRSMKKSLSDQNGLESEALDGDSILNHLKRQVRLDRKSLIDLYMELDEERSASAVAANNAMAMITRLQAEKAAVQMEALQYQRMMDEQAEYDQEALQYINGLLAKREEEMKELEAEIEAYRLRYGLLSEEDGQGGETEEFHYEKGNETKPVSNVPVCSSNHEENLEQMKDSEEKSKANNDVIIEDENQNESRKTVLVKEISEITERLNAIESKGELLEQISDVLDVSEGEAILLQISQNLHMLRSFIEMPLQS